MVDRIEARVGHHAPAQTQRVRRRVMRQIAVTEEQLKLAETRGWEFWRSFRILPGQVLARKDGDNGRIYGPITKNEDILELLVNERLGYDG